MQKLLSDFSAVQSHIESFPGVIKKLCRDDGSITVSACPPGSEREEDILTFTVIFVEPSEYPSSQAWLMSDNEAMSDMLCAIAEEFSSGATLQLVLTRVLSLIGHEPEILGNLFNATEIDFDMYAYSEDMTDEMDVDFTYASDVEFEDDRDMMVSVGFHQGKWDKFEEKYELEEINRVKEILSQKEKLAEKMQIFDTKAAYKLLCKELASIMKEESPDMMVDAIGNNVYTWNVELGNFSTDSDLYEDLMALREIHGYSTVQLHVTFKRGLHPFYPPMVEVIRPRFKGPVNWAVSSHPMLRLANWDPLRSQKLLIMEIKLFLEKHARVDLDSPFNSLDLHPIASYSDAEILLARLEGLLEVRPRCADLPENKHLYDGRDVHVDEVRLAALNQVKSNSNADKSDQASGKERREYWAAGTGYGTGHGTVKNKVWDAKKAAAAQNAHDIETRDLLSQLTRSLHLELEAKEDEGSEGSSNTNGMTSALIPTLNDSCLIPFLLKELSNVSFTNMCDRVEYYLSVVNLVKELCHPLTSRMLCTAVEGQSVFSCLIDLETQAQKYTKVIAANSSKNANKAEGSSKGYHNVRQEIVDNEARLGTELADSVIVCVLALKDFCREQQAEPSNSRGGRRGQPTQKADDYAASMKSLQIDFENGIGEGHTFSKDSSSEQSFPKERLVRLGREIAGLGPLLPLNPSSSVFVRIDDENQTLWKAMIVGPEDTPYSGGCFIFDIYFPPSYPHAPPKVILKTTGGGRVRFNPNLYNNGKVCLSLLGTWSGTAGETWDSAASSIYQVLVSIQSLILVNEPYFNEPGYEEMMHTEQGQNKSKRYNQDIREHTIHRAMIDYVRSPPKPFGEIVTKHFRLRRGFILETCQKWIEEAALSHNQQHASRLKTLVTELKTLLDTL